MDLNLVSSTTIRATATIICVHCPWQASHTADSPLEVDAFLRTLLLAHVLELHPERAADLRIGGTVV
jgi:hypothetical protein